VVEERRERGDLHAGISTCDYKYFTLEIGESVGMELHVQYKYVNQYIYR